MRDHHTVVRQREIDDNDDNEAISITSSRLPVLRPKDILPSAMPDILPPSPILDQPQRLFTARRIHRWKSPALMLTFFVVGLTMSLAHCMFYLKLRGKVVGDSDSQEEKLRFGTAFAFLAQISFSASVWTVHTQLLWRTVHKWDLNVDALNAAFRVDTSVMSFLNIEMLQKMRLGSAMAIFAWTLLLPPFFTPATLFVYPSTNMQEFSGIMPSPAIANIKESHKFAYSPPTIRGTTQHVNDTSRTFTGPRTALSLISTATASLGEILTINSPYNSSVYSISFYAPIIKCEQANPSTAALIDDLLQKEMTKTLGTAHEAESGYYSFVPTYDQFGNLTAASSPRQQSPSDAANQLWMTFLRPKWGASGRLPNERHYQVCRLHNSSYDLTVTRDHGFQNVIGSYDVHEEVAFPDDKLGDVSNMVQHAYSAFMWVICDQIVGKFSWYEDLNQEDPARTLQFGVIDSQIARTSLLGSQDLDAYFWFDEDMALYKTPNWTLSDQRLQDKARARNRTLSVLIEELSFNTTVSLMHNTLLTQESMTKVVRTDDVNRYDYKPYGLFIPYALACAFALISVVIGSFSYIYDGVMPDKKFQDIVSAAEDPAIVHIIRTRSRSVSAAFVDGVLLMQPGPEQEQKETLWQLRALMNRWFAEKVEK